MPRCPAAVRGAPPRAPFRAPGATMARSLRSWLGGCLLISGEGSAGRGSRVVSGASARPPGLPAREPRLACGAASRLEEVRSGRGRRGYDPWQLWVDMTPKTNPLPREGTPRGSLKVSKVSGRAVRPSTPKSEFCPSTPTALGLLSSKSSETFPVLLQTASVCVCVC